MSTLCEILGPEGAIARRMGERYEHRPQQLEMASAVEEALAQKKHLLAEAGTGVGKSFAYLIPAIDYAVKNKKRVVISTHTISLQEQLIDKDIPLIQSVYPDEFTAVLVKGRSNYLCQRRLKQARGRQGYLFDHSRQLESLSMIEEWAAESQEKGGLGSLAELPSVPEPDVWDKVCAEQGNCLGKKCEFFKNCFWQDAKRRMSSGNLLIVNHALFFSDLALRTLGVNYLPKYDVAILDEAHTLEDVAGQHFGLKFSEAGLKYLLRSLYDPKKGRGMLSVHGSAANAAITDILELHEIGEQFFTRCLEWQRSFGRSNGRIRETNVVENDLTPKLRELHLHIKAILPTLIDEEEISEVTSVAGKVAAMAESVDAILGQKMEDAVYWMDFAGRTPQRITLHASPVNMAEGLRRHLFGKISSVVMCSATLCTSRSMGVSPMSGKRKNMGETPMVQKRQGAKLPHWIKSGGTYSVNFRLADSLPKNVVEGWRAERAAIITRAMEQGRPLTDVESSRLQKLFSQKIEQLLDKAHGECWLGREDIAEVVGNALKHFDGSRYQLLSWCIMPNHVHVVFAPMQPHTLPQILHGWKSFTAHRINEMLGRTEQVWEEEYFDHLVRDQEDLDHCIEYAWSNPEKAGFKEWKWRGKNEAKIQSLLGHGRDAHATEEDGSFDYIRQRLGADNARGLRLGSPFDYAKQATLYIEPNLPEPADPLFMAAAGEKILNYLKQTEGGAFVLFTSYKSLTDTANRLKPSLDALGLPMLVQGQGDTRRMLLERFRANPRSVLFGTSSFWQGIDVQGDALRNVIIVKLPFAVPDEPIVEARLDAITKAGGNAFMEYSVPEAIIKLKQGVGRLIRSKTDTGIIVVLDSRIKTKRYGKLFLESLPACRVVEKE